MASSSLAFDSLCYLKDIEIQISNHFTDLPNGYESHVSSIREWFMKTHRSKLDSHTIVRFLKSENWDQDACKKRLDHTFSWREMFMMDRILTEPGPQAAHAISKLAQWRTCQMIGMDKSGHPILWENTGYAFHGDVLASGTTEEWTLRLAYECEKLLIQCRDNTIQRRSNDKNDIVVDKFVYIGDLSQLNFFGTLKAMKLIEAISTEIALGYPELIHEILFVNAPSYVSTFVNAAKAIVAPATHSKFQIFENIPTELLLARIDAEVLPASLGGRADVQLVTPEIPHEEIPEVLVDAGEMKIISQGPFTKGMGFHWAWELNSWLANIEFEVRVRSDNREQTIVHENNIGHHHGEYISTEDNTYIELVFDNRDSTFRSKVIRYTIGTF